MDILTHDNRADLQALQQEDMMMLGKLIFVLACNNTNAINNLAKSVEVLGRHYSPDMKQLAIYLISSPSPHKVSQMHYALIASLLTIHPDPRTRFRDDWWEDSCRIGRLSPVWFSNEPSSHADLTMTPAIVLLTDYKSSLRASWRTDGLGMCA